MTPLRLVPCPEPKHRLLAIVERPPKYWEFSPSYEAECECGRVGPRCIFRDNAVLDHERHEKDPSL